MNLDKKILQNCTGTGIFLTSKYFLFFVEHNHTGAGIDFLTSNMIYFSSLRTIIINLDNCNLKK